MKTPDEIKKGLGIYLSHGGEACEYMCHGSGCPYDELPAKTGEPCGDLILSDALAYIQQLEREKAALMVLVKEYRPCWECIHRGKGLVEPCLHCDKVHNHFEWRGVKEPCTGASDGCTGASGV